MWCNAVQIPSKRLSINELQHITSNIKHWLPVPLQHFLGKVSRTETFIQWLTLYTLNNRWSPRWRDNLPPQELSQKSVKHCEQKIHQEQAIHLLPHTALPTLKATWQRNHKNLRLFNNTRQRHYDHNILNQTRNCSIQGVMNERNETGQCQPKLWRGLQPVNQDFLVEQQFSSASGNTALQQYWPSTTGS